MSEKQPDRAPLTDAELDQWLTAWQQGSMAVPDDETARFSRQLATLADHVQPRDAFVHTLRHQLLTQTHQTEQHNPIKKTVRAKTPRQWVPWLRRAEQMKRTWLALSGVTALVVIAFLAWRLVGDRVTVPNAESVAENVPAQAGTAAQGDVDTVSGTDLPAADMAANAAAPAIRGLGGGGGGYGEAEGFSTFANATVTLNAALPTATNAAVYATQSLPDQATILANLEAFAARMGVAGPIYFEWGMGMPVDGTTSPDGAGPYSYRIFDGNRRVSAYGGSDYVYEVWPAANELYQQRPLPFEESRAIAERFAQENGLLDFPYIVRQVWGYEVQFMQLVDGAPLNHATLSVSVGGDGSVGNVVYRPALVGAAVENVALRSAESAWTWLQENYRDHNLYFSVFATDPAYYAPSMIPGQKTNWQRQYEPGQTVSLYSWIQVFRPMDGTATPLMFANNMRLAGDVATLEAIAAGSASGNVLLTGTLSGATADLVLNVADWSVVTTPSDLFLNGVSRKVGNETFLELPGGFQVALLNAPSDLPSDQVITVYSYGIRTAADGCGAEMDWNNIDLVSQPTPLEGGGIAIDPFADITQVTIDRVGLIYQMVSPGEMFPGSITAYNPEGGEMQWVPMWWFTGTTNKGDIAEFTIPALESITLP
jgi:hypothetical protein